MAERMSELSAWWVLRLALSVHSCTCGIRVWAGIETHCSETLLRRPFFIDTQRWRCRLLFDSVSVEVSCVVLRAKTIQERLRTTETSESWCGETVDNSHTQANRARAALALRDTNIEIRASKRRRTLNALDKYACLSSTGDDTGTRAETAVLGSPSTTTRGLVSRSRI